jgi:hypothetical protein
MNLSASIKRRAGNRNASGLTRALKSLATLHVRIYGCQHRDLSRVFTRSEKHYRACMKCGAQRRYDIQKMKMFGPFYFETPKQK